MKHPSSQPLSAEWQRQRQAGEFHWDLPEGDICFKMEDTMFAYNKESELKVKKFEIFSLKSWYQLSWPEFTTHRGPEQLCASLLCHLVVIVWVLLSRILGRCLIFDLREMKSLQNLLSAREVKETQSGAMTTNSSHESEKYFLDIWDFSVTSNVIKSLSSFYWAMTNEATSKDVM